MTIEELKERVRLKSAEEQLSYLGDEILALVEAVEADRDDISPLTAAVLDAFNAKLEEL